MNIHRDQLGSGVQFRFRRYYLLFKSSIWAYLSSMTKPELLALIDTHVMQIREHVDSVLIFCTLENDDGTSTTHHVEGGAGNYYAQNGHVEEWLLVQKERTRHKARLELEDELEDED